MKAPQLRHGWQTLNRVYIGQIASLNTKNSTVSVIIFDGLGTKRDDLELPMGGFSMNGHQSSWLRYMPQLRQPRNSNDHPGGDLVYVAFGPRGEARIVGYATTPGMYASFVKAGTSVPSQVPYGDFTRLRQGEWDMRSSGGAYVYGSSAGSLLLAAGPTVQARFNKEANEVVGESGSWKLGSVGSFLRLGTVKRLLPGTFAEADVSGLDPTAPKEFYVHLERSIAAGVSLPIASLELGAVRDSTTGLPVLGSVGSLPSPLRERKRIYAVNGDPIFTSELDDLGNHNVQYGLGATIKVDAPVADFTANLGSTATLDAVALNLGALATSPAVHGDKAMLLLSGIVTALAATGSALTGAVDPVVKGAGTALSAAMASLQTVLAQPNGPTGLLSAKVKVE